MKAAGAAQVTRAPQVGIVVAVALVLASLSRAGDAPEISPERVNRAIDAGVEWLKKAQREDGSWGPCVATGQYGNPHNRDRNACYYSGPTSFTIFTLASCGVSPRDSCVRRGLKWLRHYDETSSEFRYSYESASIALMLVALYGPKDRRAKPMAVSKHPHMRPKKSRFTSRDWRWLQRHVESVRGCMTDSGGFGYWGYGDQYADVSATQFAALALREARRAGFPLLRMAGSDVWLRIAEYLKSIQQPSGEFVYHAGEAWSAGRTAAGLSTLLICREQLELEGQESPEWLGSCIAAARASLGRLHSPSTNNGNRPYRFNYHYCHLYAVERVGALSGKKVLGDKDWYRRGARWLLSEQGEDGEWRDSTCMGPKETLGTCFALLFLKRATAPSAVTITERK